MKEEKRKNRGVGVKGWRWETPIENSDLIS